MSQIVHLLMFNDKIIAIYERQDVAESIKRHLESTKGLKLTIVEDFINPDMYLVERKING